MIAQELRDVLGYEGIYAVTNDGRVWTYPRTWIAGQGRIRSQEGRWLKSSLHTDGYVQVKLTRDSKSVTRKVHRLVAIAWIPNPQNLPAINHLNGTKADNRHTNLEWCTKQQNSKHAWATGLQTRTPAMAAHSKRAIKIAARSLRKVTFDQASAIRRRVAAGEKKSAVARDYGLTYWSVRDIVKDETYAD